MFSFSLFFPRLVDFDQFPNSKPMLDFSGKPNAVDELVCFQESQTLPLFIIGLKEDPKFTPMPEKPPFDLTDPALTGSSVSSSSPSTIEGLGEEMTRAAFVKLNPQGVIDYLTSRGVELDEDDIAIFKKQKIDGETLLESTKEELIGLGIPFGLAGKILKRTPRE